VNAPPTHSAVDVEHLFHERLNSDRVDFEQDQRVLLVEVTDVRQLLQQLGEDAAGG